MTIFKILQEVATREIPNYTTYIPNSEYFPSLIAIDRVLFIYDNESVYGALTMSELMEIIRLDVEYTQK